MTNKQLKKNPKDFITKVKIPFGDIIVKQSVVAMETAQQPSQAA